MVSYWRKWRALFDIYVQDSIAYRASAFIWLLTDAVPCVIMPIVWLSAYNGRAAIGGFNPSEIVMYYLVMTAAASFITSHLMWDIAWEIKEGILSQWLVRPYPILGWLLARNLAWRSLRLVLLLPLLGLCLFYFRHQIDGSTLHLSGWLVLSVILGHLVSFFLSHALASTAFWVQEAHSVFALYYVPMLLLSGWVAPIGLTPPWIQALAMVMPFRYTTAVPVEIALGKLSGEAMFMSLAGQAVWVAAAILLGMVLWQRGLKIYAGVGM